MRRLVACCFLAVAALVAQQPQALMTNADAFTHYQRMVQLMDSTTAAVPGLARAGAPVIENTKQSIETLRGAASPQDGGLHYAVLTNVRAYLALADAMPKPFPFPQEGARQFTELRLAADRAESHFQALLALKETQLRNPDRDNLKRYAEANARIGAPAAGKPRVVFLGDSITDGWRLNEYFPDKDYVNRGISGQTTGQMLGRMQADVVALKPAVMVVLAGTNDIARNISVEAIENNLQMIATIAEANKIKPVFASILPVHDYNKPQNPAYEMTKRRPMDTIRAVNQWLRGFCQQHGYAFVDYFAPMLDPNGYLKQDLANDGLHPNAAGYRVMAPVVDSAIQSVLGTPGAPPPPQKKKRFPF